MASLKREIAKEALDETEDALEALTALGLDAETEMMGRCMWMLGYNYAFYRIGLDLQERYGLARTDGPTGEVE